MQINEQELAQSVDAVREGESVLGVTHESIMIRMTSDNRFMESLIDTLFEMSDAQPLFEGKFDRIARALLTEALRTHKETQAGLM